MKTEPDILGISRYIGWKENGRQVYGIRGIGKVYKEFYREWYSQDKVIWNNMDFPWDYNTFTESAEKDLIEKYGDYIMEDKG